MAKTTDVEMKKFINEHSRTMNRDREKDKETKLIRELLGLPAPAKKKKQGGEYQTGVTYEFLRINDKENEMPTE